MNIYLIGFMGSGKSFTGQQLAAALHLPFVDLDERIEQTEKPQHCTGFSIGRRKLFPWHRSPFAQSNPRR